MNEVGERDIAEDAGSQHFNTSYPQVVMSQRLDTLEQRLYDDGTDAAIRAYAQALVAAGDPLGTLISMELVAHLDSQGPNIRRCHPEIFKLRARVLNPSLRPKIPPHLLQWQHGLVVSTTIGPHIRQQNKWLEGLLSTRAGRAIRHISFRHSKATGRYKKALQSIVERGAPNLRRLELSVRGSSGFDGIKGLDRSAPRLEVLHLCGTVNAGALSALGTVWPHLHTLTVDFDLTPVWKKPQSGKKLAKLFAREALPKLRCLRLERTGLDDALLDLIVKSGVLNHLEFLQVGGFFTEAAVVAFLAEVPQTCQCQITRYAAQSDHQTVVSITHRGRHPQQDKDYASLWEPLAEVNWWEQTLPFDGAEISYMPRNSSQVCSTLPDGTLHGRQSRWTTRNGVVITRSDSMYWYGMEHGQALLRKGSETEHRRFINGLRDESGEHVHPDGTLVKRMTFAQGVRVEDCDGSKQHPTADEAALHARFGVDFTTEENSLYTLGRAKALSSEQKSIPQIAQNLTRTDDGVRVHDLHMKDGSNAQVALWSVGDTTCGVILDGKKVLALIEDLNIRAPSS